MNLLYDNSIKDYSTKLENQIIKYEKKKSSKKE